MYYYFVVTILIIMSASTLATSYLWNKRANNAWIIKETFISLVRAPAFLLFAYFVLGFSAPAYDTLWPFYVSSALVMEIFWILSLNMDRKITTALASVATIIRLLVLIPAIIITVSLIP